MSIDLDLCFAKVCIIYIFMLSFNELFRGKNGLLFIFIATYN